MLRLRWILLLAAVLLTASAIAGVAQPRLGRSAAAPGKTIVVTGTGTVTAVPDRAAFSFSVETRAKTAAAALAQNAGEAAAVIAAVKAAGIPAAGIQTSQVSLSPQTSQDGTTIVGYLASNSVTVKIAIDRAGRVVDAAVGAGATSVSGPSLDRSDQEALYRDALKDAVADAKLKAQALADASGLQLGGVQSITEGSVAPTPIVFAQKAGAPADVPIEPGTQEIQATATVTFAAS